MAGAAVLAFICVCKRVSRGGFRLLFELPQIIFLIKKIANIIFGILTSQNFQFIKVNIDNTKPKVVFSFFINKFICAT